MSVFVVIRSPAPPRLLFSARARIDRRVIWSGQMSSSLRSSRRYFGSPGVTSGARGAGAGLTGAAPVFRGLSFRDLYSDSVPPESGAPESVPLQVAGWSPSRHGRSGGGRGLQRGQGTALSGAHAGVLSARRPSSMSSSTWTRRTSSTAARHDLSPR